MKEGAQKTVRFQEATVNFCKNERGSNILSKKRPVLIEPIEGGFAVASSATRQWQEDEADSYLLSSKG